jgi:dTMP kinase
MAASRAQHVAEIIDPALSAGKTVICDRFLDSSIVYQGYGRKLDPERISKLNELAVNGVTPDLTILLDVPVEVGLTRRNGDHKAIDRLDLQQKDFYDRVNDGFRALAKKNIGRYVVIDGIQPIPQVASRIWSVVSEVLVKRNGKTHT